MRMRWFYIFWTLVVVFLVANALAVGHYGWPFIVLPILLVAVIGSAIKACREPW